MKSQVSVLMILLLLSCVSLLTLAAASPEATSAVNIERHQSGSVRDVKLIHQKVTEKITTKLREIRQTQEAERSQEKVENKPEDAAEVITSASQRGRERGERNREFGERLSDPNLTQEERQRIIQEKKDYNRGNH